MKYIKILWIFPYIPVALFLMTGLILAVGLAERAVIQHNIDHPYFEHK